MTYADETPGACVSTTGLGQAHKCFLFVYFEEKSIFLRSCEIHVHVKFNYCN
jgi:hypothetical protein